MTEKTKTQAVDLFKLPEGKEKALAALMKITKDLVYMAEQEEQALATSDMLQFAVLQNEKNMLAERYSQYSYQFSKRIEEFRGTDTKTLDELDALQVTLNDKARMNNDVVKRHADRARNQTKHKTLSADQLSGRAHIKWDLQLMAQETSQANQSTPLK